MLFNQHLTVDRDNVKIVNRPIQERISMLIVKRLALGLVHNIRLCIPTIGVILKMSEKHVKLLLNAFGI